MVAKSKSPVAKPKVPSDIADKFMLRLPDGLRARIAESARHHGRSMNSDIVSRLLRSFEDEGEADRLDEIERRLGAVLEILERANRAGALG